MNDTTRLFPRTLNEAFPGTASYAESIERPRMALQDRAFLWACGVCFVAFLVVVLLVPESK